MNINEIINKDISLYQIRQELQDDLNKERKEYITCIMQEEYKKLDNYFKNNIMYNIIHGEEWNENRIRMY